MSPGPNSFEDQYPIPVTMFEDVQQEEFWSVGVRSFGHGNQPIVLPDSQLSRVAAVKHNIILSALSFYTSYKSNFL